MIFAHVKPDKLLAIKFTRNKKIFKGIAWELLNINLEPDGRGNNWWAVTIKMLKLDNKEKHTQTFYCYEKLNEEDVKLSAEQLIEYIFYEDDY